MLDNAQLADNFELLSRLMEIHGENAFKIRSYASAARTIEKYPVPLAGLKEPELLQIKGIGEAIAKKIQVQLSTGHLPLLEGYLQKTPSGILQLLQIKGLGPKKIALLWHDLDIEDVGELLYACNENRLLNLHGFGAKTQESIKDSINFFLQNRGQYLYADMAPHAGRLQIMLDGYKDYHFLPSGAFREQQETLSQLQWVTDAPYAALLQIAGAAQWAVKEKKSDEAIFLSPDNICIHFILADTSSLYARQFETTGSPVFHREWQSRYGDISASPVTEESIFEGAGVSFIPPYMRETAKIIDIAGRHQLPVVIRDKDIKGIIHCHSNWSDGTQTLEAMALAAKDRGMEYLVISDHSKAAAYAHGLSIDRVVEQQKEVDRLNGKLAPFKIFKSIESDILGDGSLDYPPEILQTFDLVIASIHSNLKMTEEKAMQRLLTAIANPFTSILGHMTGRLLLSRSGYPVNHTAVIDACARHNVVIELNAHPRRLDIDWKYINEATGKGVLISIDPDAHSIGGMDVNHYGVLVAQKAGLTASQNLSSFSLAEMEDFVKKQKEKRLVIS